MCAYPGLPLLWRGLAESNIGDTNAEVFCNAAAAALESLYDLDGRGQLDRVRRIWLGDNPVEDWYGVTADALGHVTELDLEGNGLAGRLSGALGNLTRMTVLRIADNALDGPPAALADRAVILMSSTTTARICASRLDADFQRWLEGIASHRGDGSPVRCR